MQLLPLYLGFRIRLFLIVLICLLQLPLIASLEPKLFYQKLREPTPQWMTEQIEKDLAPFQKELSQKYLDELWAKFNEDFYFIRVRVAQGQLTFEKSKFAVNYKMTKPMIGALTELHALTPLPDMDFIFTLHDVSLTKYSSLLNADYPSGPPGPIFAITKNKLESGIIIMPDWYALHEFHPDKTKILEGRRLMLSSWESKYPILFFRGGDSGVFDRMNWRNCARPKLVALSLQHPDLIDAKFNYFLPYEDDPSIRNQMVREGMLGRHVPIEYFPRFRYLMDVDGHSANTPRVALCLYSGSVLFKQTSNNTLWFFTKLKPYVHFIPVAEDLSDIFTQIEWAKNHDEECKKIALNAFQVAEETLRSENVYLYLYRLLEAYSKKQKDYYNLTD